MSDAGYFIDASGDRTLYEPEPGSGFPILCGPWPNPNEGAIPRMCSCCSDPVGVSPKGLAYHEAVPDARPLLCGICFPMLCSMLKQVAKGEDG